MVTRLRGHATELPAERPDSSEVLSYPPRRLRSLTADRGGPDAMDMPPALRPRRRPPSGRPEPRTPAHSGPETDLRDDRTPFTPTNPHDQSNPFRAPAPGAESNPIARRIKPNRAPNQTQLQRLLADLHRSQGRSGASWRRTRQVLRVVGCVAETHHDGPSATARTSESGKSLVKTVVEFSKESPICFDDSNPIAIDDSNPIAPDSKPIASNSKPNAPDSKPIVPDDSKPNAFDDSKPILLDADGPKRGWVRPAIAGVVAGRGHDSCSYRSGRGPSDLGSDRLSMAIGPIASSRPVSRRLRVPRRWSGTIPTSSASY